MWCEALRHVVVGKWLCTAEHVLAHEIDLFAQFCVFSDGDEVGYIAGVDSDLVLTDSVCEDEKWL